MAKHVCSSFLTSARCSGMQAQNATTMPSASHGSYRFQDTVISFPKPDCIGNYSLLRGIRDTLKKKLKSVIWNSKITERKPVNFPKQIKLRLLITHCTRKWNHEKVNRKQRLRGWRDTSLSTQTRRNRKTGRDRQKHLYIECAWPLTAKGLEKLQKTKHFLH